MAAIGLAFQMPSGCSACGQLGVINGSTLTRHWRYATVIIAVIAAAMPGADPVTTGLETLPLVILFLASIVMLKSPIVVTPARCRLERARRSMNWTDARDPRTTRPERCCSISAAAAAGAPSRSSTWAWPSYRPRPDPVRRRHRQRGGGLLNAFTGRGSTTADLGDQPAGEDRRRQTKAHPTGAGGLGLARSTPARRTAPAATAQRTTAGTQYTAKGKQELIGDHPGPGSAT